MSKIKVSDAASTAHHKLIATNPNQKSAPNIHLRLQTPKPKNQSTSQPKKGG